MELWQKKKIKNKKTKTKTKQNLKACIKASEVYLSACGHAT